MSAGRLQGPERCRGSAGSLFAVVVLFLIASSGIAWVSMGLYASDRWPIRWLEINGGFQRVSAEQLRASLTPLIDRSFFALDLEELRAAAGRISWVSSVQVRKVWPWPLPSTGPWRTGTAVS